MTAETKSPTLTNEDSDISAHNVNMTAIVSCPKSPVSLGLPTANRKAIYKPGGKVFMNLQGTVHECEIIEKKDSSVKGAGAEYYVHFVALDRRLDRWVPEKELFSHDYGIVTTTTNCVVPTVEGRRVTRRDKRKFGVASGMEEAVMDGDYVALEKEHEERTKVKNINSIQVGGYLVDTWYWSPYPDEYRNVAKLYICEYCLRYMRKQKTLNKHTCLLRHPPGNEIYRDKNTSVFEVA